VPLRGEWCAILGGAFHLVSIHSFSYFLVDEAISSLEHC